MIISGLSGNEIYCLAQKGYAPGKIVVGNSVYSLGVAGGISSSFKAMAGGEIGEITSMISEGRHAAISRLVQEAQQGQAQGVTGVASDLKTIGTMKEFLAVGSAIHSAAPSGPFF